MLLSNRISFFIVVLVLIAVSEAKNKKKRPSVKDKEQSDQSPNSRAAWPYSKVANCKEVSTVDTGYVASSKDDVDFKVASWPKCGLSLYSENKGGATSTKTKLLRIQKNIVKLQQSIEDLKTSEEKDAGDRIVNGVPVFEGEWPWLVAVGDISQGAFCGGSIISPQWVLTAAHCFEEVVDKPCKYNVRAGVLDWKKDPSGDGVDRRVVGIYRHPKYDDDTKQNDIALLKLEKPLTLDPDTHINAICLPETDHSALPGTSCSAAGWGLQVEGQMSSLPVTAMMTELPVIGYNSEKCGKYGSLLPGMVCAGYTDGSTDTCQGDSGGPLTYEKAGTTYLLGATSFGKGCAMKGYPGVYTDVGYFRPWIYSVVKRFSGTTTG